MINENFVYIGSIIFLWGSWTYFIDTVKGKVKPNRVSWFLWGLNPLIAFFAMTQQRVGLSSVATLTYGLVPVAILIASFLNKKSYWKIEKIDIICGILSLIGIILWYITRIGNFAILFSIFADACASLPTIIKSYKEPETENWILFFTNALSAGITLLTVKNVNFQSISFPLYIFLDCILLTILIACKIGKKFNYSQHGSL